MIAYVIFADQDWGGNGYVVGVASSQAECERLLALHRESNDPDYSVVVPVDVDTFYSWPGAEHVKKGGDAA